MRWVCILKFAWAETHLREFMPTGQYMHRVVRRKEREKETTTTENHFDVAFCCFYVVAIDGEDVSQSFAGCVPALEV